MLCLTNCELCPGGLDTGKSDRQTRDRDSRQGVHVSVLPGRTNSGIILGKTCAPPTGLVVLPDSFNANTAEP